MVYLGLFHDKVIDCRICSLGLLILLLWLGLSLVSYGIADNESTIDRIDHIIPTPSRAATIEYKAFWYLSMVILGFVSNKARGFNSDLIERHLKVG